MVVNEKVLVREMKEAYKGWGYTVMVTTGDKWVFRRTPLVYGCRRVWQEKESKQILLIDPRFEGLMDVGGDSLIRRVGENIYLEGEISEVYITRARGGASEEMLDHLALVSWA